VAASSAADRGAIPEFFAELRRRRVYRVLVGYGAFAVAMLGATQVLYEAFDISQRSFRIVVVATLAGLPLAIVLAWIFDITATGIKRTDSPGVTARFRFITWFGLGASTLAVIIIGYLLLR
jgi:hypothetical protein